MISVRPIVAVVAGSCIASAFTSVTLAAFNVANASQVSSDAPIAYLAFFALLSAVTTIIAGSLGLGWHTLAQRNHWTTAWVYVVPATLVGGAIPITMVVSSGSAEGLSLITPVVAAGLFHGALTGLFAWLIRRPDRDAPNPPTPVS